MIPDAEAYDLDLDIRPAAIERLLSASSEAVATPSQLTFGKNIFLPITTACRYTCGYCAFFDPPGEASLLSPETVRQRLKAGKAAGCTEALFTFGDRPDDRYQQVHKQLAAWGYESLHGYVVDLCEMALEAGLLPHVNAGDLTNTELAALGPVTASMGLMLETTADVPAHAGSRAKTPGQRLETITQAGQQRIPFTTGLLVGIGETPQDRAESILAIKQLHDRYDHIQEVIIQPVTENERWDGPTPSVTTLRQTVAMARTGLPADVSVQVPPNIAPIEALLDSGVDDLGGISPVTDDYVNPNNPWPELDKLRQRVTAAGRSLYERLPVRDRYLPAELRDQRSVPEAAVGRPASGDWLDEQVQHVIESHLPINETENSVK